MAIQVSYPGVYIDEFAPAAPIQGVGTNIAAFIGVASAGEMDVPTKLTSWDQFRAAYGAHPVPGFFLWYAVRGFFENGGQVCYVVRASNGEYAGIGVDDPANALPNRANVPLFRVRARQPGVPSPAISIQITGKNLLQGSLFQPASGYTIVDGRRVQLADAATAAQYRPGDWINLGSAGASLQIQSVSGAVIRLAGDLTGSADPAGLRLADASKGTRVVRITLGSPPAPGVLGPGTLLSLTQGAPPADSQIVESVQTEHLATSPVSTTYRITFREGLGKAFSLDPATPATLQSEEFDIEIAQGSASTPYENLVLDPAHPRHYLTVVNGGDQLVRLDPLEPSPATKAPGSLPADTGGAIALTGGAPEDLAAIRDQDFIDALDTLRQVDDVNLVSIPDCLLLTGAQGTPQTVQQAALAHCEQLADRFAVMDARPGLPLFGTVSVETQRQTLDSMRGYAALYYPWLRVASASPGGPVLVPPSGHVCGVIARSDATRGVHKAPANEVVNGALGIERTMSDVDQGLLNLRGVNVIRIFQTGGRPVVWGARTTATDTNWQYVNIRRLFLFLEESIQEGIRWAIFEPNHTGLWAKLKLAITEFLTRAWRDGALFGARPQDAFYVRIDEVLNPDSSRALGRLTIEVGVRPSYPAEFIVVRIGIWHGGSEVNES